MLTLWLPKKSNTDLRRVIELELIKEEVNPFLNTIDQITLGTACQAHINRTAADTINTIFIDNILGYVKNHDPLSLITLINNSTLAYDFSIAWRHCEDLLNKEAIQFVEDNALEQPMFNALTSYVNYIYENNKEQLNEICLKMFDTLYHATGYIDYNSHRVTYPNPGRPLLVMTGGGIYADGTSNHFNG